MIKIVTDATFDGFLSQNPCTVVDFWAPWCHPCIEMEPRLSAISEEFRSKVTFAKMNTDENPKTRRKYHIKLWPTLIAFRNQASIDKMTYAGTKAELSRFVRTAFELM